MKEKLLAAHRHGIFEVDLPKDNEKDLPDIPENIRKEMKLHFVDSMDEVLKIALEREIVALPVAPPHRRGAGGAVQLKRTLPTEERHALARKRKPSSHK